MKVLKSCQSLLHPNIDECVIIHSSLTSSTHGIKMGKGGMGEVEVSFDPTWCQDDFKNDQGAFLKYINSLTKMNECKLFYYTSKSLLQCLPNAPTLMDDIAKDLRK